ncbi:MAG: hypothetical protein SWZ49_32340 [Cyanobacteriota bacterium]|nr:hypothetical protein [Cyanobacteriota bacterium]
MGIPARPILLNENQIPLDKHSFMLGYVALFKNSQSIADGALRHFIICNLH